MGRRNVARGDVVLGVAPGTSWKRAIAPDGATESPSPLPGRANPLCPVPGAKLSTASPLATLGRPIRGEMSDTIGRSRPRHGKPAPKNTNGTGRLLFAGTGEGTSLRNEGIGRDHARAQQKTTAHPVTWVRGTERCATGRSSDLRLVARIGMPSRDERRSGEKKSRDSDRIQQRPCAGFSPASLFVPPRGARREPIEQRDLMRRLGFGKRDVRLTRSWFIWKRRGRRERREMRKNEERRTENGE